MSELQKPVDLDAFLVPVCPECHKPFDSINNDVWLSYDFCPKTGKYMQELEIGDTASCRHCCEETVEFEPMSFEPTTLRMLMNKHPATHYIYCGECNTWYDHWKNTDEHKDCKNTRHPNEEEHIQLIQDDWIDGCVWLDTW